MDRYTHPLNAVRKARGLTQRQLAKEAGVSVGSVMRIESDARLTSSFALVKIAMALGIPMSELAGPNQKAYAEALEWAAGAVKR
jgi:transcriptional regulator with XRE-family HTH domain